MVTFKSLSSKRTCYEVNCNFDSTNAVINRSNSEPTNKDVYFSYIENSEWFDPETDTILIPNDGFKYWVIPVDPNISVF